MYLKIHMHEKYIWGRKEMGEKEKRKRVHGNRGRSFFWIVKRGVLIFLKNTHDCGF